MPVKIRKLKNGKYRVSTPNGVKAKATTKTNAMKQARLLRMLDAQKKTGKKAGVKKSTTKRTAKRRTTRRKTRSYR